MLMLPKNVNKKQTSVKMHIEALAMPFLKEQESRAPWCPRSPEADTLLSLPWAWALVPPTGACPAVGTGRLLWTVENTRGTCQWRLP